MDWDNAQKWADKTNEIKRPEYEEPNWSWDCGLKLDFDGGLLRVSSRFYQQSEDMFDGAVSFYIGDDEIFNREFSCAHIDVLKEKVERYVSSVTENIKSLCEDKIGVFVER